MNYSKRICVHEVCEEVKKLADLPGGGAVKGLVNLLANLKDTAPNVYRSNTHG